MRNLAKNLNRTHKVCSASTSNTRNRVPSSCVPFAPPLLYKVTIQMMEYYPCSSSSSDVMRLRRVTHADIYAARSSNEAIGLAVRAVTKEYAIPGGVDVVSIRVSHRGDLVQI